MAVIAKVHELPALCCPCDAVRPAPSWRRLLIAKLRSVTCAELLAHSFECLVKHGISLRLRVLSFTAIVS